MRRRRILLQSSKGYQHTTSTAASTTTRRTIDRSHAVDNKAAAAAAVDVVVVVVVVAIDVTFSTLSRVSFSFLSCLFSRRYSSHHSCLRPKRSVPFNRIFAVVVVVATLRQKSSSRSGSAPTCMELFTRRFFCRFSDRFGMYLRRCRAVVPLTTDAKPTSVDDRLSFLRNEENSLFSLLEEPNHALT